MQINEILSRLDRTEGRFPHDAVAGEHRAKK